MRPIFAAVLLCFSAISGFSQSKTTPAAPVPAAATPAPAAAAATPAPAAAAATLAPAAAAIPAPAAAAPVSYSGEAVVVERADTEFRYNADGTGEETGFTRVRVQNEAGARQCNVVSIPYPAATESAKFESVRVTHADGTFTDTPGTDVMDMPAPVTQEAPLYSDLKTLQVPVRGLRVGDTLEFRVRIEFKTAEAPGQFWNKFDFVKTAVVLSQTLTLDLPADKYVQVWSATVKPAVSESGGRKVYRLSSSQLKSTSEDNKKKNDAVSLDYKPDVVWTTFHSWQEVGDWYRGLAAPRAVPNDALRAQADEITKDAKTPQEQVQAIYAFVATRIRYVGIDFGIGRYEPHAAAEVLANQYGDCKDKDTLLEALLHAKGFATAPALVGVGIAVVPEAPTPGQFNHVITTVMLPAGQTWVDSTPGSEPMQELIPQIRDKQALVIPATGVAALERTPAEPPFPLVDRFEAKATLKPDGDLTGHVDINDRSDSELLLRTVAGNVAPAQWDKGAQYLVNLMGFSGTASNATFARADDFSVPMHLSYDYEKKPFGDWENFRILPLFPVVDLPEAPDKQPSADIDLGSPRTVTAESRIKLPDGYEADLLDAIHIKTRFLSIDKTYSLENGELVVKRTIVVLQSKLPADEWMVYKKFVREASLGEESFIQLTTSKTSATASVPHPPAAAENNPAAAQLVAEAVELEKGSDLAAAVKKLDAAKEIAPTQPYLWSNYGYIAMRQNKREEAKKDVRQEVSLHPDEINVVEFYAAGLRAIGDTQEAQSVLSAAFDHDPAQERVALMLAALQAESNLPGAIATLRRAATASPDSHTITTALATDLMRNHQGSEAVTILKKELESADDAETLNDASYALAETGTKLPLAEQKTRKALEILNAQSGKASIGEANAQSFHRASLLVATWDTMGYILLRENKLDEANGYLEAAWVNRTSADVGDHYGQVLEKLGKPGAALRVYELVIGTSPTGLPSDEYRDAKEAVARLQKAGVKPVANGVATSLQDGRTFSLPLKEAHKTYVSATFRLQFLAGGAPEVLRVSGDSALDDASDAIRGLHLPQYVPAQSTARLLRDAVVTCSPGKKDCFFVLMPMGGINAEGVAN